MVRPGLRPNTFKDDPTRAPPEHFEANFSYGYEKLAKQKRAQRRKNLSKSGRQREATGGNGRQPRAYSRQRSPGATRSPPPGGNGRQREATGGNGRQSRGARGYLNCRRSPGATPTSPIHKHEVRTPSSKLIWGKIEKIGARHKIL